MLETILVYSFLMFVMFYFTNHCYIFGTSIQIQNITLLIPILAYTIIFGIRYFVGVDYPNYLEMYETWDSNSSISWNWNQSKFQRIEPGFIVLLAFCKKINHPIFYFSFIAFLQIFFIYKAFNNKTNVLAYSMIAFICTGMAMIHFQNGLRQYIAIPIFIYAFQFLVDRKPLRYFLWVTIAVLFHKSAAILYPLYFLYSFHNQPFIKNKLPQYIMLIFAMTCAFFDYTSFITDKIDALLLLTNYDVYSESDFLLSNQKRVSIIMIMQFIIYLFFATFRKDAAEFYKDDKMFGYIYDVCFVSMCLFFIFFRSLIIVRILRYFITFDFILLGYYFNYLVSTRFSSYRNLLFYVVINLYLFASFSAIMRKSDKSTIAYVTYFQTDMHAQKELQRAASMDLTN